MLFVVSETTIGKYKLLELDSSKPHTAYSRYVINGKTYRTVPLYDTSDNFIAIESSDNFIGQTVSFE